MSVHQFVQQSLGKAPPFGIAEYRTPKVNGVQKTTKTFHNSKAQLQTFVDLHIKAKANVPSPANYDSKVKWDYLDNGKRGGFMKNHR